MILSALIKKDGLTGFMTATPATLATQEPDEPVTVASVAGVAVAEQPEPTPDLSSDDESNIRAWLEYIEETDPESIADVLSMCRNDLKARRYFLKRSGEVPESAQVKTPDTC